MRVRNVRLCEVTCQLRLPVTRGAHTGYNAVCLLAGRETAARTRLHCYSNLALAVAGAAVMLAGDQLASEVVPATAGAAPAAAETLSLSPQGSARRAGPGRSAGRGRAGANPDRQP